MKNQLGCFRKPSWLMIGSWGLSWASEIPLTKSWMISNMAFNTPWSSLDGLHVVMVSLGGDRRDQPLFSSSLLIYVWLSSDRILGLINTISIYIYYILYIHILNLHIYIYIYYKSSIFSLVQHDIKSRTTWSGGDRWWRLHRRWAAIPWAFGKNSSL